MIESEMQQTLEIFVRRLVDIRREKKISQKTMSRLCGIGKRAVERYENEGCIPSMQAVIKIADFADVSIDYLLGRTDNQFSHKKN